MHWKSKLDELEIIPGEAPFDRTAAWQTLKGRLQQRPVRRTKAWYWVAAACLLGIIVLSMLMRTQPDAPLVNRDAQPKHLSLPKTLPQPAGGEVVTTPPQQLVKVKSISPHTTERKGHPVLVRAVESQLVLSPDPINNTLPAITIPLPNDTAHLVTAIQAKKKLRVVHINELNGAVDDVHLASNAPAASSKKYLHDDDAGLSLSRNASDNIVKIKISSN